MEMACTAWSTWCTSTCQKHAKVTRGGSTVRPLHPHPVLQPLEDLREVRQLEVLKLLRDLDLRLNPFTREEHYRTYIVHHLPFLSRLDERDVAPGERRIAADVLREVDASLLGELDGDDEDGDNSSYFDDGTNGTLASPSKLDVDTFMMQEGIEVSSELNHSTVGGLIGDQGSVSNLLDSADDMNRIENKKHDKSMVLKGVACSIMISMRFWRNQLHIRVAHTDFL